MKKREQPQRVAHVSHRPQHVTPRDGVLLFYGDALHGAFDKIVITEPPANGHEMTWLEDELAVRMAPGCTVERIGDYGMEHALMFQEILDGVSCRWCGANVSFLDRHHLFHLREGHHAP